MTLNKLLSVDKNYYKERLMRSYAEIVQSDFEGNLTE